MIYIANKIDFFGKFPGHFGVIWSGTYEKSTGEKLAVAIKVAKGEIACNASIKVKTVCSLHSKHL